MKVCLRVANYCLGTNPAISPSPGGEDQAKLIRAGSDIVFEIHYTANGTEQTDFSEFGLYFTDKAPRERVLSTQTQDLEIAIPAGDPSYQVLGIDHLRPAREADFASATHAPSRKSDGNPGTVSQWQTLKLY